MNGIASRIDANVFNFYRLPEGAEVRRVPASALLTPKRLDIVARYLFAKHYIEGWGLGWASGLYRRMLECWNAEFRDGDGRKHGFGDYLRQFGGLIDAMAQGGYDAARGLIPVAGGTPVDGAHRLAAALYLRQEVEYVQVEGEPQVQDAAALLARGMGRNAVEQLVAAYAKLDSDCYMAIVFPEALPQVEALLERARKASLPVYDKRIVLTAQGRRNVVKLLYGHETWWEDGKTDDFVKLRFPRGGDAHVLFVKTGEGSRPLKQRLREILPAEHCMHMNDTHAETGWMADIFLNANGREYLNMAPDKAPARHASMLEDYRVMLAGQANPERFCIDSGGVLAAFGLRDCGDLDYLSTQAGLLLPGDGRIGPHHGEYAEYALRPDEIVADPGLHFAWKGVKLMALGQVMAFKHWRGSLKDRRDCGLILSARPRPALRVQARRQWARLDPLRGRLREFWATRQRWAADVSGWGRTHLPVPAYLALRAAYRLWLQLTGGRERAA